MLYELDTRLPGLVIILVQTVLLVDPPVFLVFFVFCF